MPPNTLLNGKKICAKRGQYTSKNNEFIIDNKIIKVPTYIRPKIKNASGIFSADINQIDFVDLIVGSEGIFGLITALGLAVGANIIRSVKDKDLVPAAVIGKFLVAIFALFFVDNLILQGRDNIIVPLMCIMCVGIPFVLVTIAPRFITAAEVNLFFLLETIIGPIWVWLIIKEQPSIETIYGGILIIITIAVHSFYKLKKV